MPALPPAYIRQQMQASLAEDWGTHGDLTSQFTIPAQARVHALLRARKPGVIAGLAFAKTGFAITGARTTARIQDGARVRAGQTLLEVTGKAHAVFAAERVGLNYLGHLSGIATTTAQFVHAVRATQAKIYCTRKTTPGLREAERYAVRMGGGYNHRATLSDALLIKDNHIALSGTGTHQLTEMVRTARAKAKRKSQRLLVEVEIDTMAQIEPALAGGADMLLLDNMSPAQLRRALAQVDGRVPCEASGNITLRNVASIAKTGVGIISTSALIQGPWLDMGLDISTKRVK